MFSSCLDIAAAAWGAHFDYLVRAWTDRRALRIDGKPVTTVFLLVTPTVRAHLYLLSRLSAALHDELFKEAIVRRDPERVLNLLLPSFAVLAQALRPLTGLLVVDFTWYLPGPFASRELRRLGARVVR